MRIAKCDNCSSLRTLQKNKTIKKREKPLNFEGFLRFFASADEILKTDIAFFCSENAKKIEEKWAVFIVTKGISL